MKNTTIRMAALAVSIAIVSLTISGCSTEKKTGVTDLKPYSEFSFSGKSAEDAKVCENTRYILTWNNEFKQVIFTDKQSGKVYSSMPSELISQKQEENTQINPNVESPIIVSYYNPSTLTDTTSLASTDAIDLGGVYCEQIKDGIRVFYDFSSIQIVIPVEYKLSEDCFTVTVHPDEIFDSGDNYVTGVSIAPFLCSVKNDTADSYLFYPDGSGALFSAKSTDMIGSKGSQRIYGEDLTVNRYALTSYTKQIHMPVFGAKSGDSAIFAVITDGAEQAWLNWNIGSQNIGYSSVYPFFRIRGYNQVEPPDRFANARSEIQIFDSGVVTSPLTVSYYTLNGDTANYNGMSRIYRSYLTENSTFNNDNSFQPVISLKILGGLQQKRFTFGIPHTVLQPLTTISKAREMTEYFDSLTDGRISVCLEGFGTTGLDTGKVGGGFKIASELGKTKEIVDFANFCRNKNIGLFMNFDIVGFRDSGCGFSVMGDSAKLPSGQSAYLYFPDNVIRNYTGDPYVLLSRAKLSKAVDKAVNTAERYGISGVSFDSLSSAAYSDYSVSGAEVSSGMAKTVQKLFSDAAHDNTLLAAAANDYAVSDSDCITDAPLYSSEYDVSFCDIPFYEMVFSGLVPMSSEALNLSVNSEELFLRCIEAGVCPSFTLLDYYDSTVVSSKFSSLCGARYSGLKDSISETVQRFLPIYSKIENAVITSHTVLNSGLRITEYDNGVCIAVNYTDETQQVNGHTVTAGSYALWGEN